MANFAYIIPIFGFSTLWLFFMSSLAPKVPEDDENSLRFPTSFEDLFKLSKLFKSYHEKNRTYMYGLFISAYIYKQVFCIPGSALLNILAGTLFGLWAALPLCCLLTGIGASLSYLLSKTFAEHLVVHFWPNEVNNLRYKVESHRDRLFYYLLSLRLMPLTPNWLINLVSPLIGIPLHLFFITIFFGLIPYNYICVQAGAMLSEISTLDDIFTWKTMIQLSVLAFAILVLPRFIKKHHVN